MSKKRDIKTTVKPTQSAIANAASKVQNKTILSSSESTGLLFDKKNYMYILGGIGFMVIGFFLMSGGNNTDPNVFDENVIYSTRRTLIAPIFILAGLVVQVLAIFKK